jgi:hypothetical protein
MPNAHSGYCYSIHRGGDLCTTPATLNGVTYDLDVDCETGIVLRVATEDLKFSSPEGIRIGSSLGEAFLSGAFLLPSDSEVANTQPLCRLLLPSGWIAEAGRCDARESERITLFLKSLTIREAV